MKAKTATSSLVAIVCSFVVISCPTGFARMIHVANDGSADYPTIQAAIDASIDGALVLVAPGTYRGDGSRDILASHWLQTGE